MQCTYNKETLLIRICYKNFDRCINDTPILRINIYCLRYGKKYCYTYIVIIFHKPGSRYQLQIITLTFNLEYEPEYVITSRCKSAETELQI